MRACMLSLMLVMSTTVAEPNPTVQWLMKDPLTLFDWGIESLNRQLSNDLINHPESWSSKPWYLGAEYDYLTDRIYIVSRVDMRNMSEAQFRAWCETAFSNIRGLLRVDENGVATTYDEHFSHKGFHRADRPDDLADGLSKITILIARSDEGETAHICETPLSRGSISYRSESIADD